MSTPQAEARLQMRSKPLPRPRCPYCDEDAELVDKSEVYKRGYGGKVWLCRPCDAWVLAHRDPPYRPTGTLAKSLLRALRLKAICLFDQLWRTAAQDSSRSQDECRHEAYAWLASEMGIPPQRCQIGYFSHAQTQVVIDICMAVGGKKDVAA